MAAKKASAPASTSASSTSNTSRAVTLAARVADSHETGIPGAASIVERPRRLLLSVEDAMAVLSYTRPRFYREVNHGRIETIKDGKRRMVPYVALVAYVRRLCDEQGIDYDALALAS